VATQLLPDQRLLRLGEALKGTVDTWKEGADLVAKSGLSIDNLCLAVARDRWYLARSHFRAAESFSRGPGHHYRAAVSRYYYAMYHAMRAAVFLDHGGDDFEAHAELPSRTPKILPNAAQWQNALKSAREHRNRADYDPYPRRASAWARVATDLRQESADLLALTRRYLIAKGCRVR